MTTLKAKAKIRSAKPKHPSSPKSRTNTKRAQPVALIHRPQGATIDKIATVTGWQDHSVRGAISGALKKRLGLEIASGKEKRGRVYWSSSNRSWRSLRVVNGGHDRPATNPSGTVTD
jgi:hypothetical protein